MKGEREREDRNEREREDRNESFVWRPHLSKLLCEMVSF